MRERPRTSATPTSPRQQPLPTLSVTTSWSRTEMFVKSGDIYKHFHKMKSAIIISNYFRLDFVQFELTAGTKSLVIEFSLFIYKTCFSDRPNTGNLRDCRSASRRPRNLCHCGRLRPNNIRLAQVKRTPTETFGLGLKRTLKYFKR